MTIKKLPRATQVIRLDRSSYMGPGFFIRERALFQEHLGLDYHEQWDGTWDQKRAAILISNTHTQMAKLDPKLLAQTALIIHPNSGYDNFPFDWVKKHPIPIILGNTIRAHAVSDTIVSALLAHLAPIPRHAQWDRQRQYKRRLLKDSTALIIGYGEIGKLVEQKCRGLVKAIQIFDPYQNKLDLNLGEIDICILAASLNPTSHGLINQAFLQELRPGFTLINTARGELVNEADLKQVLTNDPVAFAYLDVFAQEPCDFSSWDFFVKRGQVQLTSHIAGVYPELETQMLHFEQQVILDYLNNGIDKKFKARYQENWLHHRLKKNFLI